MKLLTKYRKNAFRMLRWRYKGNVSYDKIRFFARKTVKYGNMIKIKQGNSYKIAYCCYFFYGFEVFVIFWDKALQKFDEKLVYGVLIQHNTINDYARKHERKKVYYATDFFYPDEEKRY